MNDGKQARLIIGNNVLAHVPQLNDFVDGLQFFLKPDGIITMEFPHLMKLIEKNQFDTIYHEHFSYFSLRTVQDIFASHKLKIFDVEEISTHGGSLRIYVTHSNNAKITKKNSVDSLIEKEIQFGMNNMDFLQNYSKKVIKAKLNILKFLISIKESSKKIACYGAPAKGNTLLNYCGIGSEFIDYTVDISKYKQGKYLPGTHIPIENIEFIRKTKPDFLIILAWNLKDEIIEQMNYIRDWKGKFVTLLPQINFFE